MVVFLYSPSVNSASWEVRLRREGVDIPFPPDGEMEDIPSQSLAITRGVG